MRCPAKEFSNGLSNCSPSVKTRSEDFLLVVEIGAVLKGSSRSHAGVASGMFSSLGNVASDMRMSDMVGRPGGGLKNNTAVAMLVRRMYDG